MLSNYEIYNGNSLEVLKTLGENSIDSIVCDPPYELGFMNKKWDSSGIAYNVELWKECLRVLKPGGHLLAFSGSRTYHRMAVAIEDAGFDIRNQIMWVYATGFPKSHDVSKAFDKMAGAQREVVGFVKRSKSDLTGTNGLMNKNKKDHLHKITVPTTEEAKKWEGWGTALKPAHEPICLARKPIAENDNQKSSNKNDLHGNDIGLVAKFFYYAKASKKDRDEGLDGFEMKARRTMGNGIGGQPNQDIENNRNHHPTVKPTTLMQYLCKLVTPSNGIVLDPFMGSGSTGKAAMYEGFRFIGIDLETEYCQIAKARIEFAIQDKEIPKKVNKNKSRKSKISKIDTIPLW